VWPYHSYFLLGGAATSVVCHVCSVEAISHWNHKLLLWLDFYSFLNFNVITLASATQVFWQIKYINSTIVYYHYHDYQLILDRSQLSLSRSHHHINLMALFFSYTSFTQASNSFIILETHATAINMLHYTYFNNTQSSMIQFGRGGVPTCSSIMRWWWDEASRRRWSDSCPKFSNSSDTRQISPASSERGKPHIPTYQSHKTKQC